MVISYCTDTIICHQESPDGAVIKGSSPVVGRTPETFIISKDRVAVLFACDLSRCVNIYLKIAVAFYLGYPLEIRSKVG